MIQHVPKFDNEQQRCIARLDPDAARYWYPLRYHPVQAQLWTSLERGKRFVGAAAGRGSGKTEISRRKLVLKCIERQRVLNPYYFYALPTSPQAKKVAWEHILPMIPKPFIVDKNITEQRINFTSGAVLYIVGMDKPVRIEGLQYVGGIVDESCDQKPKSFDLTILPALTHHNGWCWRIGVPKRRGVGAADFKKFCLETAEEYFTWSSMDILTEEQLSFARGGLDQRDFDEQFGGKWLSTESGIFYAFGDHNIVENIQYDPNRPIIVGSDFNVDPMAWVIGQEFTEPQINSLGQTVNVQVLHIFDKVYLRNTNTQHALNNLYERYGDHKAGWVFFGDASSKARKTSASLSDYLQIKNDHRFANARIYYPSANPPRADRFASTNRCLQAADGIVRCRIHPRCKELIQDLEERSYKPGTTEPDDYNDIGHCTDALGYVLHTLWPYSVELGGTVGVHVS